MLSFSLPKLPKCVTTKDIFNVTKIESFVYAMISTIYGRVTQGIQRDVKL